MYADPKHIRDHVVKVRLNEEEKQMFEKFAQFRKQQQATLAHDLIMQSLKQFKTEEEL